jgi:hypothetical protein
MSIHRVTEKEFLRQ